MAYPNLSPRRWFWTLLCVSAAWCAAGWRWDGDSAHPRWMQGVQGAVSQPVRVMVVPAEFIFHGIEGMARAAIERVTVRQEGSETREALAERVKVLESQNAQLSQLLDDAMRKAQALINLPRGITERDILPVSVVGTPSGAGSALLHVDKGAMDGLRQGMAVMPMGELTVLGRLERVDQKESVVRLLTDPSVRVEAEIVRGTQRVTTASSPCVVEGIGGNQMRITNVDVQSCSPDQGDLVVLSDKGWPAHTQFMVIGTIERVGRREDQPQRYYLRVSPRVNAGSLQSALVILRQ